MNGLLLSVILHIGYTLYFLKKSKCLSIHNLISIWFSFIVIMGWFTVQTNIYQNIHGNIAELPYEPYIYEFLSFTIFMWPFRYLNDKQLIITDTIQESPQINLIIKGLLVMFFLYLIVCSQSAYYVSQQNLVDAYHSFHTDGKSLYQYNNIQSKIVWICGTIYNTFFPLVLLYAIKGLSSPSKIKKTKFYLFCILVCISCEFCACVSTGQRGGVFWFLMTMCIVFIPFWRSFTTKTKRIVKTLTPFIITIFAIYAITMTIQRVEDSTLETPITTILRYFGEPYPHLGNVFWDNVKFHPMGMRLFPFIANPLIAIRNSQSLSDSHMIWEMFTGVPILNYKTLYGDFYVEFGIWIPFIIIGIYAFILYLFTQKHKVSFWAYPILYYYINMAVCAPLWFSKRDLAGIKEMLFAIAIYLISTKLLKKYIKQ